MDEEAPICYAVSAILGTAEGDADGLEVLAMSAAMQMHLNILQMDQVWTSHHNDYSKYDVTIVLSRGSLVVQVAWGGSTKMGDVGNRFLFGDFCWTDVAAGYAELCEKKLVHTLGGWPRVRTLSCEFPLDLGSPTQEDQDLSQLKKLYTVDKKQSQKWCTPDTKCQICDYIMVKGADLYWHMKDIHLEQRPYGCWSCEKNFQTDHDWLNHMNAMHRVKAYKCTQCLYSASVESRILEHVCTHATQKFECASCEMKLSTKVALHRHTLLHLSKEEFLRVICKKSYASQLVLGVHTRGKHGQGYMCPKCDTKFDAPIKKAWHLHKCKAVGSTVVDASPADQSYKQFKRVEFIKSLLVLSQL